MQVGRMRDARREREGDVVLRSDGWIVASLNVRSRKETACD